jgi:hypothetical protein
MSFECRVMNWKRMLRKVWESRMKDWLIRLKTG